MADSSIRVSDLALDDLWCVYPDWPAATAWTALRDRDFDAAPLAEPLIHRFVRRVDLEGSAGSVMDHALPITADHLVASDLGLAVGLRLLADQQFFFVLKGNCISSIVTFADLQREPVSMVALAFILSAEAGLDRLIRATLSDSEWMGLLPRRRLVEAGKVLEERRHYNTSIDLVQCLMLYDRARIIGKSHTLLRMLSYSRTRWNSWANAFGRLRDVLAHGGNLLDHAPDPVEAIRLLNATRDFAERVDRCLSQLNDSPS